LYGTLVLSVVLERDHPAPYVTRLTLCNTATGHNLRHSVGPVTNQLLESVNA